MCTPIHLVYFEAPDLDQVYAQFVSKGWPASEPSLTSDGMRMVATLDPDGFKIIFISPA